MCFKAESKYVKKQTKKGRYSYLHVFWWRVSLSRFLGWLKWCASNSTATRMWLTDPHALFILMGVNQFPARLSLTMLPSKYWRTRTVHRLACVTLQSCIFPFIDFGLIYSANGIHSFDVPVSITLTMLPREKHFAPWNTEEKKVTALLQNLLATINTTF